MPNSGRKRASRDATEEGFSAVIIADMVAHVGDPELLRRHSVRSNKSDKSAKAETKTETNLAFEGENGTSNLSRGVILNALNSGQADDRAGKILPLSPVFTTVEGKQETTQDEEKGASEDDDVGGFVGMSTGRKVAFGFSFIPSIMFVLCFAVILPCNKFLPPSPCSTKLWRTEINDSDVVTSTLSVISGTVLFSASSGGKGSVTGLNATSGEEIFHRVLLRPCLSMDCGRLLQGENESCLLQDTRGDLHLLESSTGHLIESWNLRGEDQPSPPFVMPDCVANASSVFGMATSPSAIQLLRNITDEVSLVVPGCDSVPEQVVPWTRNGTTDLVLTCREGSGGVLRLIPESKWCVQEGVPDEEVEVPVLAVKKKKNWILLPTEDGLFAWVGDDVIKFDSNATIQWTASSEAHSEKNRFLLFGKFDGDGNQVALFSTNGTADTMVSTLNSKNGTTVLDKVLSGEKILQVETVHGKNQDFAVVLKRKVAESEPQNLGSRLRNASVTLAETLVPGELNRSSSAHLSHQISLLQLRGSLEEHLLLSKDGLEGDRTETTFRVVSGETKKLMHLYVLHKKTGANRSELVAVEVENWDVSVDEVDKCRKK